MKITVKREFDGKHYVGSIADLPGCYVQSDCSVAIPGLIRNAISIYKNSYEERKQELPQDEDGPILNIKIKFDRISTRQLHNILKSRNYHIDFENGESLLMANSNFPFNRIHIPQSDDLSPLIVQKIFGKANTHYVKNEKKNINKNVS